jgi:hypothetical protein
MNYSVKFLMMTVLGVGLLVPAESKAMSAKAKTVLWITSGAVAALCSYIALTQKEQKKYEGDSLVQKAVNWFRRVICGTVSKKEQVIDSADRTKTKLKDTYTKATGLFGHLISFYDANEKDIKKAAAIGGLVALGSLNTNIKEIIVNLFKGAPYGEFVKAPNLTIAANAQAAAAYIGE